MNTPALPRDAKTWKLAALVAMGLFVGFSSFALMERWLHPERALHERHDERPERMHRHSKPPEVERQFEEFWKKY
ncbi:MAG: hypothetical protein K9N47_18260 [Prosthecobacter sp.]|uniref:hypothetical protein n=1 Tax=Prosthecobacter sp. TaxID=1965333 RepID=UPI0025DBE18B|nr:hypothetical protein [Prosthecobacter sp.]MCF7788072.1 hypothetical protein [Prosthecobacter sp.]